MSALSTQARYWTSGREVLADRSLAYGFCMTLEEGIVLSHPRVALLEVSHWHAPLYVEPLKRLGVPVVGVSDAQPRVSERFSELLGCPAYSDWRELLRRERVDFAFVFGRHREMPGICEALVAMKIPFAVEKPLGTSAQQSEHVARVADAAKLFAAVPFILRHSPATRLIRDALGASPSEELAHLHFRFVAGPPQRYVDADCSWMLDAGEAGGGCTANLAIHFIDLFRHLVGQHISVASASMSTRMYRLEVEDFSTLTLTAQDGVLCTIETGYTFPGGLQQKREAYFSIGARDQYFVVTNDVVQHYARERGLSVHRIVTDTDPYYGDFVADTLARFVEGAKPTADLWDLVVAARVLDEAYALAGLGLRSS